MIGLIAFVAYDYFTGGSLSEEEKSVKILEEELQTAANSAKTARRSAAVSGMDTTSDLEMAINIAKGVKIKLDELMEELESDSALDRAEKLKTSLDKFLEKNNL